MLSKPPDEIGTVQRGAQGPWGADGVTRQRYAMADHTERKAQAQAGFLRCSYPVLSKHQVPAWPAAAARTWHDAKPAQAGRIGLALAWLQHRLLRPKDLASLAQLPPSMAPLHLRVVSNGYQIPGRR